MVREKQTQLENELIEVEKKHNEVGKEIRRLEGIFINKEKGLHPYILKLIESNWNFEGLGWELDTFKKLEQAAHNILNELIKKDKEFFKLRKRRNELKLSLGIR